MLATQNYTGSRRDHGTRLLLGAAAAGLTAFVGTFLVEGLVRPGYSPWRHAVSQLSLGPFGWVNTIAILVAATALGAFAAGLRRALPTGTGSKWGPRLIAMAAICFGLLAVFPDDPALGYPPGTPAQQTLAGLIHGLAGTVTFGSLSAACFVLARRFAGDPAGRGWARYSTVTGLVVGIGYVATAVLTGLGQTGVLPNAPGGLVQRTMIITGFGWVVLLTAHLLPRAQLDAAGSRAPRDRAVPARPDVGDRRGPVPAGSMRVPFPRAWPAAASTRARSEPLGHISVAGRADPPEVPPTGGGGSTGTRAGRRPPLSL